MKKLLLLLLIPFISCDMSSTGVVGILMSDDDVEYYSGTEAEDELTESVLEMAEDYVEADFEEMKEYYSDSIVSFFNSNEVKGLSNLIDGWTFEHELFSDIKISDEYAHTNYFSDGRIWTNYWFTWSAKGNYTGQEITTKAHFDYEWKDGKIVQALGFFADEQFNKEFAAAMEANSN